jgi:hypothetical protein
LAAVAVAGEIPFDDDEWDALTSGMPTLQCGWLRVPSLRFASSSRAKFGLRNLGSMPKKKHFVVPSGFV